MMREYMKSFRRSWVHHTGMQLATLSVLCATFFVVVFTLAISVNLKRLLAQWGDSVQMIVYIQDSISPAQMTELREKLKNDDRFKSVEYVAKEQATASFKQQMASYAPDLLADAEFANPFPASFQLKIRDDLASSAGLAKFLEVAAEGLTKLAGVEDVSYGQGWIKNYAAFVRALSASGWTVVVVLLAGSLFVISNSVRASIAARREEIEILELVGATNTMIRAPYVFEGALTGLIAAAIALATNFVVYSWEIGLLRSTFAFSRLVSTLGFLGPLVSLIVLVVGAILGALGAYVTVCQINDGWSASRRNEI